MLNTLNATQSSNATQSELHLKVKSKINTHYSRANEDDRLELLNIVETMNLKQMQVLLQKMETFEAPHYTCEHSISGPKGQRPYDYKKQEELEGLLKGLKEVNILNVKGSKEEKEVFFTMGGKPLVKPNEKDEGKDKGKDKGKGEGPAI